MAMSGSGVPTGTEKTTTYSPLNATPWALKLEPQKCFEVGAFCDLSTTIDPQVAASNSQPLSVDPMLAFA